MATIKDSRQQPLFIPTSSWKPRGELPTGLLNMPIIALDTETCDPQLTELGPSWFRGGGHVAGISLAWPEEGAPNGIASDYLPIAHEGGDNLSRDNVLGWLRDLLKNFSGTLVMMNAMYDCGWLRMEKIELGTSLKLWDIMMVAALLDEHQMSYKLNALAKLYKLPLKDEAMLNDAASTYGYDPKSDLWRLPARFVGAYAARDAALTLEVQRRQVNDVQRENIDKVVRLEHELVPLLMQMRWNGVRADRAKAEQQLSEFMTESETYRERIKDLTGYKPDIWSADSCAVALDKVGIKYRATAKGAPSITDEWMATFEDGTVPHLINKARKAYRAGQTFCKGMVLDHLDANNRIHCEFHPLRGDDSGTVSGRFSSSNPNLQQVPGEKDPRMGTMIRGLFLPEEDAMWCAADYSQQEPRLTVHYAAERGCSRGVDAAERYTNDPNTDYHNFVAELVFGADFTKAQRKIAKTINLGLAYGMGGAKLARKLGLPTEWKMNTYSGKEYEAAGTETQAILDKYHAAVPFMRELSRQYSEEAKSKGHIRTLIGRVCRFTYYEPTKGGRALPYSEAVNTYGAGNIRRAFTHAALNRKIQGGSADMVKLAMLHLWREGVVPHVTVHDEVGCSVGSNKEALRIAEILKNCVKLRVPLKVDVDVGPSWGAAKPIKEEDEA